MKFTDSNKDFKKQINKIVKKTSGKASFDELFNKQFMRKNTKFKSIEELFDYCEIEVKTQRDFDKIDKKVLDKAVKEKTKFKNWKEMSEVAGKEELIKRLKKEGIDVK